MTRIPMLCAVPALLSATSVAQSTTGHELLAFVRSATSYLARQDMDGGCKAPVKIADTLSGTSGNSGLGGGAAYDPSTESVWVSDGARIRSVDMTGKTRCEFAATLTASDWAVTGLAFDRAKRRLIQLEMGPGSGSRQINIRLYDTTSCPAVALPLACKGRTIMGTGVTAAGIAYDGTRDLLYYNESIAGFRNASHVIHVARLGAPCTDINTGPTIAMANCAASFGPPITGMGYSECDQRLYVTLLDQTRVLQMTAPTVGMFVDLTNTKNGGKCCPIGLPSGESFQGLAVLPDHSVKAVGQSCTGTGCTSCNSMRLGLVGAPVLGNSAFAVAVDGAPQGSVGSFYLSVGACTSGLTLPGICAPIYPAIGGPMPLLVGAFVLNGTSSCGGQQKLSAPVPFDPALCGFTLCTQWLVICSGGGIAGATNAVEFTPGG